MNEEIHTPALTTAGASDGRGRIVLWDNLKFLLILTVVLGHFVDQYDSRLFNSIFLFTYSFHMPLFIFVAGLFHRNTRVPQKVCAYLAIYFVYKALLFVIGAAFGKHPSFSLLSTAGVPWYIFALAAFIALTYILRDVNRGFLLGMSVFIACLAGYDPSVGDMFCLSRILVYYPFYLLGTMFSSKKLEAWNRKPVLRAAGLLVLFAWLVSCYLFVSPLYALRPLLTGRNAYGTGIYTFGWLYRLGCYALACVLGLAFILVTPSRRMGPLTTFGQRTLQVFFWHRPILFVMTYLGAVEPICSGRPGRFLWMFLAAALTLLLSLRAFSFPTDWIMRYQRPGSKAEIVPAPK